VITDKQHINSNT